MRQYETVEIPATTKKEIALVRCDLCAQIADQPRSSYTRWGDDQYDVASCRVELETGTNFPEDGGPETETIAFDICPTCFRERLVPWLRSQGAEPHREVNSRWSST